MVTEHYWPETFLVNDLVAGLRERGHELEVLTAMPNYPHGRYFDGYRAWGPYSEVHEGVRVHRVPVVPRGRGQGWRLALNYASYALAASIRAPFLGRRWDAALVFQPSPVTTCLPALVLRALAGLPVVLWVQDLWPESISASGLVRAPWAVRLARRLSAWLYSRGDRVVAQSEAFLPRLEALGVQRRRLGYAPNWADAFYQRPAAPRDDPRWAGGFPIVFAGNLGRVQGLDTVLEAARRLRHRPEIRWVFVGDGPLREWLAQEARRRGLEEQVLVVGRKPATEMPGYFASAGAMLVSLKPDPTMALTIPSKVQAYLAAGRPILASLDGEGARVVEESGAGWAAPAGDPGALAASALRMYALSPEDRAAMGRRGRAYYAREFDRGVGLGRIEQALAAVVGRERAGAALGEAA